MTKRGAGTRRGARRGRKRSLSARRRRSTRAGRRPADFGTPELQKKRAAIIGFGDPALAEHALGILLGAELITREQYDAAWIFAAKRYMAFGKPFARCPEYDEFVHLSFDADTEPALSDEKRRLARAAYIAADEELKTRGTKLRDGVQNIAIYQRTPQWYVRARLGEGRVGDDRAHQMLLEGLEILVRHFTRAEGRGAN